MNRSLEDKAYDLFGEMLLAQETDALLAEIEEEKASGQTAEMDAFFQQYDRQNLARIEEHFRKQTARRFFTKTLPKIGQIAAVLIVVISVAGGIALASSSAIRVRVMQLLMNVEKEYTSFELVEDIDASFDVPVEWGGEYYPSFIPDDLDDLDIFNGFDHHSADIFTADRTRNLYYVEFGEGTSMNLDTENATTSTISINGHIGWISVKNDWINIYWANERRFFLVSTKNIDEETTMRIANRVVRVK